MKILINNKTYDLDEELATKVGALIPDSKSKSYEELSSKLIQADAYKSAVLADNVFLNMEDAKKLAALYKLINLRREWVGDWEPGRNILRYQIVATPEIGVVSSVCNPIGILTFPSRSLAEEFKDTFSELIVSAGNFI